MLSFGEYLGVYSILIITCILYMFTAIGFLLAFVGMVKIKARSFLTWFYFLMATSGPACLVFMIFLCDYLSRWYRGKDFGKERDIALAMWVYLLFLMLVYGGLVIGYSEPTVREVKFFRG